ncbi:MAG TPA: DNA polymerase IV [Actinomycetota bacterium]|nr:DNA polymerase IV [Actinomycetota bacterium]
MSTPILHVDMDAFYASVESLKEPSLRGKPVIVGGQGGRGVVTSASYEAREFGVHSAMPMVRARRLCPHAAFVSNDFDSYLFYSKKIREIFNSFTPLVEPLSLDEAFLDVSGSRKLFGPPESIAAQVKQRIADLGLACTVGVAPNKFLAKLASARGKPDGLLVVPETQILEFLHPLPIGALWGVGPQTAKALQRLGLKTVRDVAAVPRRTLERAVGESLGSHLHHLAHGKDDRVVVTREAAKSIGSEETFAHDLDSTEQILREVLRLADRTAERLRSSGFCGRTITLKIRYANFTTITRSKTLSGAIDTSPEIYDVARSLYLRLEKGVQRIRLVGVSIGGLEPGPPKRQLGLMEESPQLVRWSEASKAVDSIRGRFGRGSVGPARLLDEGS